LNSKQSVERHEEEEEDGDVVDLLARPLEDLVDPGLWHRKLQEDSNESEIIKKVNFIVFSARLKTRRNIFRNIVHVDDHTLSVFSLMFANFI